MAKKERSEKNNLLQEYLKFLRLSHGYSQEKVAEQLHIIRQTYSHYETGRNVPPVDALYGLAALYEMPAEEIIQVCAANYMTEVDEPSDGLEDIRVDLEIRPNDLSRFNAFVEANKRKYGNLRADEMVCLYYYNIMNNMKKRDLITYMKVASRESDTDTDKEQ